MNLTLSALSTRDRRTLTIGALAIGGLLIVGRGAPAWRNWQQRTVSSVVAIARAAAADRALAGNARAIRDSLAARHARLAALAPNWVRGDSPAAAGAGLAALITRAATDAALTLGTLDIHTDSAGQSSFVPVRVRVSVSGDIQGITTLLAAIDRGPVAMNVVSLNVQGGDPAAAAQREEVLRADLTIDALWRPSLTTAGPR